MHYIQECDDVSDERQCRTVYIDPEKYLKSKPPPSAETESKLPVVLRYYWLRFVCKLCCTSCFQNSWREDFSMKFCHVVNPTQFTCLLYFSKSFFLAVT